MVEEECKRNGSNPYQMEKILKNGLVIQDSCNEGQYFFSSVKHDCDRAPSFFNLLNSHSLLKSLSICSFFLILFSLLVYMKKVIYQGYKTLTSQPPLLTSMHLEALILELLNIQRAL